MRNYFKQYFGILDLRAKKALPVLVVLFLISAMLDLLSVGLIGIFASLVVAPKPILKHFPNFLLIHIDKMSHIKFIIISGIFIIFIYCIKAVLACIIQKDIAKFSYNQLARIECLLVRIYQSLPYHLYISKNTSELITAMQNYSVQYTNQTLLASLRLVANFLVFIAIICLLAVTNPYSLLVMATLLFLIMLFSDLLLKRKLKRAGEMTATSFKNIIKDTNQLMKGFKEIRILGVEKSFYNDIYKNARDFADSGTYSAFAQYIPRYILESSMVIFVVGLLIVYMIYTGSAVKALPVLTLFMAAGIRLLPASTVIIQSFALMRFSRPMMAALYDELEVDRSEELSTNFNKVGGVVNDVTFEFSKIKLKNVSYKYPNAQIYALKDVNLSINKGEAIGVIGHSGAGKTTLIDVILGLLSPREGDVLVDDCTIFSADMLRNWQNQIAYIPQETFIIDDSFRANIALGQAPEDVDIEKLEKVIRLVQLKEVIDQSTEGLETMLGENGIRLSGGQRQRIALARALYYDRQIIVMDEATSALDDETEKAIIASINDLKGRYTLIVIAHRMSTIENCDVTFKLDHGELV